MNQHSKVNYNPTHYKKYKNESGIPRIDNGTDFPYMFRRAAAAAADDTRSGVKKLDSPVRHEFRCVTVHCYAVYKLRHTGIRFAPEGP